MSILERAVRSRSCDVSKIIFCSEHFVTQERGVKKLTIDVTCERPFLCSNDRINKKSFNNAWTQKRIYKLIDPIFHIQFPEKKMRIVEICNFPHPATQGFFSVRIYRVSYEASCAQSYCNITPYAQIDRLFIPKSNLQWKKDRIMTSTFAEMEIKNCRQDTRNMKSRTFKCIQMEMNWNLRWVKKIWDNNLWGSVVVKRH